MVFKINIRRNKDRIVVLEMSGPLRVGETVSLLRQTLQAQIRNGENNFLLDMSAVTAVDSSGLGEMVSLVTSVRSRGGSLDLTGLNKQSTTVIRMTGLEPALNAPLPILPRDLNTHWKNLGIVVVILLVAAAFYWIALR